MKLTKEQQEAIKEAAILYEKKERERVGLPVSLMPDSIVYDYVSGMQEVLKNPEKYGLKRIEE